MNMLGTLPQVRSTQGSDGSSDVYASPSGLVGKIVNGRWVIYIPPRQIAFQTDYAGSPVLVNNQGNGSYVLSMNGERQLRRYAARWMNSPFFDARGNPIARPEDARADGDPADVYFTPGRVIDISSAESVGSQDPITAADPVPNSSAPQAWARSTDGRTDVYAGDSGMVGAIVRTTSAGDVWAIWMPAPGVTYESFYGGAPIRIVNNGDGTYRLDADGTDAVRRYSQTWIPGAYYDASGNRISSPDSAQVARDPAPVFFMPGSVVVSTPSQTPQVSQPLPPATTPTGTIQPLPIYVGGGDSGYTSAPFPTTDGGSPNVTAENGSKTPLVLAAIAAAALLLG